MRALENYYRYIQIGLLVLLSVAAGWFALYGSTLTHVIAGLIIAVILYAFRKYHRMLYGICEVIVGIAALVQTVLWYNKHVERSLKSCRSFPWYVIPLATLIAVYILIRGIDDIEQGWNSRLTASILEHVPAPIESGIPAGLWMRESIDIDSLLGGGTMPKAYSADMRARVIGRVEGGGSRREAAEHYDVSPSTAVIWVKCFHETGRCAAKPRREYLAVGRACGFLAAADRGAGGLDAG